MSTLVCAAMKRDYGRVISARIQAPAAKALAKIAKAKSTENRTVRVSDLLRDAANEYIAKHSTRAAA